MLNRCLSPLRLGLATLEVRLQPESVQIPSVREIRLRRVPRMRRAGVPMKKAMSSAKEISRMYDRGGRGALYLRDLFMRDVAK